MLLYNNLHHLSGFFQATKIIRLHGENIDGITGNLTMVFVELIDASQLGGHPEWIQDATYPQCPTCQQTMPFLAQIAGEDWQDSLEGSFYTFLCSPCRKAATLYQQT